MNVGSVSSPFAPDLRASYAIIAADEAGHEIEVRYVAYDREAVMAATRRIRHPGVAFIVRCMQGRQRPKAG